MRSVASRFLAVLQAIGSAIASSLGAVVRLYIRSHVWPWVFAVVALVADGYVIVQFLLLAQPAPPPEPAAPLAGAHPLPPPTFPLSPVALVGVVLVAIYILVAFTRQHWIAKAFHLILIVVWLVFSFSWIYFAQGQETHPGPYDLPDTGSIQLDLEALEAATYPNFGHQLSKNEALYFTAGTLSTAGTGNLSAKTHEVRTAVTVQLGLDLIVLVIGVAGLVRSDPRPSHGSD